MKGDVIDLMIQITILTCPDCDAETFHVALEPETMLICPNKDCNYCIKQEDLDKIKELEV